MVVASDEKTTVDQVAQGGLVLSPSDAMYTSVGGVFTVAIC
jgi:hypothetical protein